MIGRPKRGERETEHPIPGNPNLIEIRKVARVEAVVSEEVKREEIADNLDELIVDALEELVTVRKFEVLPQRATMLSYETRLKLLFVQGNGGSIDKLVDNAPALNEAVRTLLRERYPEQWAQITHAEKHLIERVEAFLEPLLMQAYSKIYMFIGMMQAAEAYGNKQYQHYYPLIKGCKTLEEFAAKNPHLAHPAHVMMAAVEAVQQRHHLPLVKKDTLKRIELIGLQYPSLSVENQKYLQIEELNPLETSYAPRWIWGLTKNQAFRFLLKDYTLASITMAARELGYVDFLPLVESDEVSHMFAQFVAHKFFVSKGGNAQASGISNGSIQYRISSGFGTTQMANAKWLMGCKEWFRGVSVVQGPQWSADREARLLQLAVENRDTGDAARFALRQFDVVFNPLRNWAVQNAIMSSRKLARPKQQHLDALVVAGRAAQLNINWNDLDKLWNALQTQNERHEQVAREYYALKMEKELAPRAVAIRISSV